MKTVAIVQARMGSTRLPGKVLKPLAGKPMLARVVNRLERAQSLAQVIVATTTAPPDAEIVALCQQNGWAWWRGSEHDVLDRYYQAALAAKADVVVRITSDCPFIDPELVDRIVQVFRNGQPALDYVSNTLSPRTFPRGLDTEVVQFSALARAWREDDNPATREHVTPYIWRHPACFGLQGVQNDEDYSSLRWTVDTEEDFTFARTLYEHLGHDRFSWREMLSQLKQHPEWSQINRGVAQKAVP